MKLFYSEISDSSKSDSPKQASDLLGPQILRIRLVSSEKETESNLFIKNFEDQKNFQKRRNEFERVLNKFGIFEFQYLQLNIQFTFSLKRSENWVKIKIYRKTKFLERAAEIINKKIFSLKSIRTFETI